LPSSLLWVRLKYRTVDVALGNSIMVFQGTCHMIAQWHTYMQTFPPLPYSTKFSPLFLSTTIIAPRKGKHIRFESDIAKGIMFREGTRKRSISLRAVKETYMNWEKVFVRFRFSHKKYKILQLQTIRSRDHTCSSTILVLLAK